MTMIYIKVPEDICKTLSKISVPGEKLEAEEMHITLFYFEHDLKIKDMIKIFNIMYNITKKNDALNIKLTTISSFKKGADGVPIIIPIESDDLINFRKEIAKKFDNEAIKYSKKWPEFKPHLTLSYSKKEMNDKKIDKPIKFKTTELILIAGEEIDDGVIVSVPFDLNKKTSKFESISKSAQLFELITKTSKI